MPLFSDLAGGFLDYNFGTNANQLAPWTRGNFTGTIPIERIPRIEVSNTFTFSSNEDTRAAALTAFYAVATNQYHPGDIAIITVDADGTPSIVTLLYVGAAQDMAAATTASDWVDITATAVNVTGGTGIDVSGATISLDLAIQRNGSEVTTSTGFLEAINFSTDFTVTRNGTDGEIVDVAVAARNQGAYSVGSVPNANVNITLTAFTVQEIPPATQQLTFTLPADPAVGTWVKIVNNSGRSDTLIARNNQPIHGDTSDDGLTLNNPFANIELTYMSATTGWSITTLR